MSALERGGASAETFKALSDPVRLDLLLRIAAVPEMSCTQLVADVEVGASTVSYHVKLLKSVGLVEVRKAGRNYFYTVRPDALRRLGVFFDDLAARVPAPPPVAAAG